MKNIIKLFLLFVLTIIALLPASAQLNEGFEGNFPPPGWVTFNNGIGLNQDWRKETDPGDSNSGNSHAYVRFENVSGGIATDWLVTPALMPTSGDNTLTFYAKSQISGNDFSNYTVQVSTNSQGDPADFSILQSYTENQIIAANYTQFTIDLSDFIDLEIYIAFVLENDNGDSFLLDDVTGPAVVFTGTVPNCDAALLAPVPGSTDVPINGTLKWSFATGNATGYEVNIGTATGLSDFLSVPVGAVTQYNPIPDYAYNTTYYVTIIPYNTNGEADNGNCTEYTFTTQEDPNAILDCSGTPTPITKTLCYGAFAAEEFVVTSNNGSQVQLTFNAGTLENNVDEIYIYDGADDSGTLLNSTELYGNAGDLAGLTYVSSTTSIYVKITPDGTNSCQSGDQTPINYTLSCVDCNPPVGTAAIADCDNNEFYVNVNVTNVGDGTVEIADGQTTLATISTPQAVRVGPFSFGTVNLSLKNPANSQCDASLQPITLLGCTPNNDCADAIPLSVSGDNTCNNAENGSTEFAEPSMISGTCTAGNTDLWYSFMAPTSAAYVFELSNLAAFTSLAVYSGDCTNGLTLLNEECFNQETILVDLTENETYLVQVFANDNNQTGSFDLCVFAAPPIPLNDLCGSAMSIDCATGSLSNQDASSATNQDAVVCSDNGIGKGVWYQFVGTGSPLNISVQPNNWDAEIQIWSGSNCQNINCMMNRDAGTTGGVETILGLPTTNGANYYIYVGAFDANQPTGTFNLNLSCGALAVELLNFEGQITDKTNTLQWSTALEDNMQAYIIERSTNGRDNWTKIGEVTAQNQANTSYQFIDDNPLKTGYYRLLAIDHAGMTTISEVIALERKADQDTMEIFPVPAKDWIKVQFHSLQTGSTELNLLDMTGRLVYRQQIETTAGQNMIDVELEDLNNGVYILSLDNKQQHLRMKFVKQ